MSAIEYLLRVRPVPDGSYSASIRRLAGTAHPEVRAVLGPVAFGHGQTAPAAMLAAICASRVETVPAPREVTHGI